MRRFYTPPANINEGQICLNADEARHLRDVLRLRPGEKVQVFNGLGLEFLCEIVTIEKQASTLRILQAIQPGSPESNLELTLAAALLKGEKFDLVIQKAVELGVTGFVPIVTKRTDVRLKEVQKKLERWRKIVVESSKQCGRAGLMKIEAPLGFEDLIRHSKVDGGKSAKLILFSERSGEKFSSIRADQTITAVTGPEGGWEDSEIEFARSNQIKIVTLGGRIMRAETAAIVVTALLQNHFGDLI